MGPANSRHGGLESVARGAHKPAISALRWGKNDYKRHFVCKFECKFAQQQPPPHRSGRTVLALQKRRCYAPAPMGPANRDANREPGASPRAKTPTVLEFSWGKNDYIFVQFWAIWGLYCGVATKGDCMHAPRAPRRRARSAQVGPLWRTGWITAGPGPGGAM